MIKRLRIKFICVIMAITTLMLTGILGIVIHFTQQNLEAQSVSMLRSLSAAPFPQGNFGKPGNSHRSPFFTVQLGKRGELLSANSSDYDLSDQAYVLDVINQVLVSNRETGELKEHNLRYLVSPSPVGYTLIFADTTMEEETMQRLFLSCTLIFFGAFAMFLGISILLSHWTVKPVEAAWKQQRQFVADASHELKTPLSVIMANAELLQAEETGAHDFAKNILSMTYQMRSLVENMLEMARVDNGTVKMHFSSVDFSQLVNDAVLSVQLLYEEKELGLCSSIAEGIFLNGSEQHLFQVLDVLLDNALKYSTPQGCVNVCLKHSGRNCVLSVSSPGDPISQEDLKNIFKRFYRADKARAMNGSYGLGLSIAESVVTAHKGKIWAESGSGTNVFYVSLPRCI